MTPAEFSRTWLPLRDLLYRTATWILESPQDAEDALQDLYLKLWGTRNELDSVDNPKAYAIRMMKNLCIDRLRKRRVTEPLDSVIAAMPSADETMDNRQRLDRAMQRISQLPPRQRQALQMSLIEGLSYKEIAEKTGLSQLNLRVLVSTARKRIRE